MQYKLKAFGIAREILNTRELLFESDARTLGEIREALNLQYPALKALKSLFVAVNLQYAGDDQEVLETDEIALIPPVSGG